MMVRSSQLSYPHVWGALIWTEVSSGSGSGWLWPTVSSLDQGRLEFPVLFKSKVNKGRGNEKGAGMGYTAIEAQRLPNRGASRSLDTGDGIFFPRGPDSANTGRGGRAQGCNQVTNHVCLCKGPGTCKGRLSEGGKRNA